MDRRVHYGSQEIIGNQSVIAFSSQGTINLSDLPRINHWYKQIVGSQVGLSEKLGYLTFGVRIKRIVYSL